MYLIFKFSEDKFHKIWKKEKFLYKLRVQGKTITSCLIFHNECLVEHYDGLGCKWDSSALFRSVGLSFFTRQIESCWARIPFYVYGSSQLRAHEVGFKRRWEFLEVTSKLKRVYFDGRCGSLPSAHTRFLRSSALDRKKEDEEDELGEGLKGETSRSGGCVRSKRSDVTSMRPLYSSLVEKGERF